MKLKILHIAALLLLLAFTAFAQNPRPIFPAKDWQYDKCNSIKGIQTFVIDSMNTTGLLVVHKGQVIFSYGDIKEQSYVASCRKSILSLLYGPYVENGTIDLQATLEDLKIEDHQGLLPVEKKARIVDLLTARSGVYHPSSYPGDDIALAPKRGTQKPGTYFLYNNWDFNVAGAIFEQLTGNNIYDALENDLAIPLQMQDFDRSLQQKTGNTKNSKYPAYPMNLSVRDMARIGYLMSQNGRWNDQQLIPETWVKLISSTLTPHEEMEQERHRKSNLDYGYLWWVYDSDTLGKDWEGAYTAQGIYGQFITVIPKYDLVIAHKTNALFQRHTQNYERLLSLIIDNASHLLEEKQAFDFKTIGNYVGQYSNGQTSIEIVVEGENIYAISAIGKLKLIACDPYSFSIENEDRFGFSFNLNPRKQVDGLTLSPDLLGMGVFSRVK